MKLTFFDNLGQPITVRDDPDSGYPIVEFDFDVIYLDKEDMERIVRNVLDAARPAEESMFTLKFRDNEQDVIIIRSDEGKSYPTVEFCTESGKPLLCDDSCMYLSKGGLQEIVNEVIDAARPAEESMLTLKFRDDEQDIIVIRFEDGKDYPTVEFFFSGNCVDEDTRESPMYLGRDRLQEIVNRVIDAVAVRREGENKPSEEIKAPGEDAAPDNPTSKDRDAMYSGIARLAALHHEDTKRKGFHDRHEINTVYVQALLAKVTEEVGEAVAETRRHDGGVRRYGAEGKPEGFGIELADIILRVLDLAILLEIDIAQEILDKMAYNLTRPYLHGKNS